MNEILSESELPAPISKFELILNKLSSFPYAQLIIIFSIFLLYFQTFNFGYSNLDDNVIILNNYTLIKNISNIDEAFKRDAFLNIKGNHFYRPMQTITYMFDAQIGGKNPWIYHLTNVILHCLTCLSIFYLLNLFALNRKISFLLTLIYCVNPLLTQAVAWIPARGDLLIGLFGTLTIISFIKSTKSKEWVYIFLHFLTFLIALFSKETAIAIPLLCIIYLFIFERKILYSLKIISYVLIWLIISAIFIFMRNSVLQQNISENTFGIHPFLINLPTIPEFATKFFTGYNLSTLPGFDLLTGLIGIAIVIFFIAMIIFRKETRKSIIIFALSWFLLFSVPAMFYRHGLTDWSYDYIEHRAYLPMIAMLIIIAEFFGNSKFKPNYKVISIIFMIFFICYSCKTYYHSKNFEEPIVFFSNAIATNEHSSLAYHSRGLAKHEKGDNKGAIEDYTKALYIYPKGYKSYMNRGIARDAINDKGGAIADFDEAIKIFPRFAESYYNRGMTKASMNEFKEALDDFDAAINLNNNYSEAYSLRGNTKGMLNQPYSAILDYDKALSINPNFGEAYYNRGLTKLGIKDTNGCCSDMQKALTCGYKQAAMIIKKLCK